MQTSATIPELFASPDAGYGNRDETTNEQHMNIRFALLAAALITSQAMAESAPAPDFTVEPALSRARLTGSLTAGYATNYSGRGYVVSHAAAQGDSVVLTALKLNYDIGKKDLWSIDSTIAYQAPCSGHTLYGNPRVVVNGVVTPYTIGARNIENEFAVVTAAKYKRDKWNISMGHDFVHGGLLGVMAKHYHNQGASCVNEFFIAPEWTPAAWVAAGVKTSFSVQGVHGWWFEPYVTFKAPLIGPKEDVKVAAMLTFALSATADYFDGRYNACDNGTQAFWIKLATPWFVTDKKNFIITPSVSFNWLGEGGLKGNQNSEAKHYTENPSYEPFRNFGVVGSISATYTF